jgi:hypothetical protein
MTLLNNKRGTHTPAREKEALYLKSRDDKYFRTPLRQLEFFSFSFFLSWRVHFHPSFGEVRRE